MRARRALLAEEKEFTRLREILSEKRRALPWLELEKNYVFESEKGKQTLSELFGKRSQLVIYHLMFAPDWDAACKSCTFWADNFQGITQHLEHRDVSFAAVSRAPVAKLQSYAKRLGWTFTWVSSEKSEFNYDFGVSFTPEQLATGTIPYNFGEHKAYGSEMPGISVFYKDGGKLFHTYSAYARGIDMMNTAYQYLDLVPKGRDEGDQPMGWLRRRDEYED